MGGDKIYFSIRFTVNNGCSKISDKTLETQAYQNLCGKTFHFILCSTIVGETYKLLEQNIGGELIAHLK